MSEVSTMSELDFIELSEVQVKGKILGLCLDWAGWHSVCIGHAQYGGQDLFVHPLVNVANISTKFDSLIEGVDYAYRDWDYSSYSQMDDTINNESINQSNDARLTTLTHYENLYKEYVLGTRFGRRHVKQHNMPLELDCEEYTPNFDGLSENSINKMFRGLSIECSPLQQEGDELELIEQAKLKLDQRRLEVLERRRDRLCTERVEMKLREKEEISVEKEQMEKRQTETKRWELFIQHQPKVKPKKKQSVNKVLTPSARRVSRQSKRIADAAAAAVAAKERDRVARLAETASMEASISSANQVPSTSAVPMEENIDDDEDNSQEMELEFENTPGSNTSVKVTFTLQDDTTISATAVTDAAVVVTTNDSATATTTNQQPNPSPTNNNLSNQPLPDYDLANDDELELTFATQAEKKRHLDNLKLKRLAPAIEQKKSMKTGDETSHLTQVIGDKYRAGYDNVTNEIKNGIANKYSQLPILGKEFTPTPEEIELESICNETAQDIKGNCPGYTGDLLSSEAELFLLARVSTGTTGYNNGESQEVSMLAVANRLKDEDYFKLPVVLHQNIMKGLGYYRHFPEKCDAIMQTIKAILYSKYKKIILMINDTLRAFYESVHYCYFLGVVKALNPNKEIEILSCANGLVPTIGLPYIIEAIHTREEEHQVTRSEVSRVSAGANVPFDSEESRKYQHEIITKGKELWDMWKAEGVLPSFVSEGRKRVVEELPDDPDIRQKFIEAVKTSEAKLGKLNQKEPSLHNISIASDGSIIDGGSTDVFGPESGISSTSRKSNKVGGNEGGDDDDDKEDIDEDDEDDDIAAGIIKDDTGHVFIDNLPIGQLAPIIAHIKKLKLLDNGAKLWIFFDQGCQRTNKCNKEFSKLLSKLEARQFRYVFMSTLNRINSNSVAVQTFLGAQKVSPGLEIHCSLEHGKNKTTIAGNEHHRVMEKQESNNKCKASVASIEQSFPEVTLNITLHNDAKTTSGYYLTKTFRKKVEDIHSRVTYPPSSFIPFSTVDEQDQKHLKILNEKIPLKKEEKKRLEQEERKRVVAAEKKEKKRLEQAQKMEEITARIETAFSNATVVVVPNANDILPSNNIQWPGNIHFQRIIDGLKPIYQSKQSQEQSKVVDMVLSTLKFQGRRLLTHIGRWTELDADAAKERCIQALKD